MLLSTNLPETSKNFTQIYPACHISEILHFCSVLGHQVTGQSRIRSRVQELIAVQILCCYQFPENTKYELLQNLSCLTFSSFLFNLKTLPFPTKWLLNVSWIEAKLSMSVIMSIYIQFKAFFVLKSGHIQLVSIFFQSSFLLKLRETFVFMNNLCGYWKIFIQQTMRRNARISKTKERKARSKMKIIALQRQWQFEIQSHQIPSLDPTPSAKGGGKTIHASFNLIFRCPRSSNKIYQTFK